jgi:hypothetical protein
MRKAAFLLTIVTAKRHSDLAHLVRDDNHMIFDQGFVLFIPTHLSKTDRQRHLNPPIIIKPWSEDQCICPVESINDILRWKVRLSIPHSSLFFSASRPYAPLSAGQFAALISGCLSEAGISPPPGSTRSISASLSLARGMDITDVLGLGDWSSQRTFFRFYARDISS